MTLTAAQKAHARIRVQERRDELSAKVQQLAERPELGAAQGFGKRVGDGTIEAVRRLTDIGVGSSLEVALARAERTLTKLDEGTYGTCDSCGAAIAPARLSAMPDSVHCLRCAASQQPARPVGRR
jgi:DnaK suppressor protein